MLREPYKGYIDLNAKSASKHAASWGSEWWRLYDAWALLDAWAPVVGVLPPLMAALRVLCITFSNYNIQAKKSPYLVLLVL